MIRGGVKYQKVRYLMGMVIKKVWEIIETKLEYLFHIDWNLTVIWVGESFAKIKYNSSKDYFRTHSL